MIWWGASNPPVFGRFCGRAIPCDTGKALARPHGSVRQTQLVLGERMRLHRLARASVMCCLIATLAGCGGGFGSGGSGLFGGRNRDLTIPSDRQLDNKAAADAQRAALAKANGDDKRQSSIFDLFSNSADPNTTVEVNKYIWVAAQDVLNFLPIESVDPFTGVLVTGYGTPPGGGRAYRATVYVQDPALDARSLKVALQSRGGGAVAPETARAIENAILTRARQLRIQDSKL